MTHLHTETAPIERQVAFKKAAASGRDKAKTRKPPPPFSLRLSAEERAALAQAASGMPLGPYIKAQLFGRDLPVRRARGQAPVKDHAALARALGMLGMLGMLGKARKARQENERAAEMATARDAAERENLITDQLSERRVLQQDIRQMKRVAARDAEELRKDMALYLGMRQRQTYRKRTRAAKQEAGRPRRGPRGEDDEL